MLLPEFEQQFLRLKASYGEKVFPAERERLFFKRYSRMSIKAFADAVDAVILALPQPSLIIGMIDGLQAQQNTRPGERQAWKEPSYTCEPCKDHGYGWIGDTVTRCVCVFASTITDEDLARHQRGYDAGAAFRRKGAKLAAVTRSLPYNPKVRGAV